MTGEAEDEANNQARASEANPTKEDRSSASPARRPTPYDLPGLKGADLSKLLAGFAVSNVSNSLLGNLPDVSKIAFGNLPDIRKTVLGNIVDLNKIVGESTFAKLVGTDLTKSIMPDYAALIPRYNFSKLAGLDLASLQMQFDPLKGAGLPDFSAAVINIDLDRLFPKIDFRGIAEALELRWQAAKPPNWPDDSFDELDLIGEIVNDEGIPLVWVPRAEIVKELLSASSRAARISTLKARSDDLVIDCQAVLVELKHTRLLGQKPLAESAVQSLADGNAEAAQALAVLVTETAVKRAISGSYNDVKKRVKFDVDEVPFTAFRSKAAFAPVGSFFTSWRPESGSPPPSNLSRHVSVHQADSVHYNAENSLLSVLLMASVLRALQEFWDLEEPEDI